MQASLTQPGGYTVGTSGMGGGVVGGRVQAAVDTRHYLVDPVQRAEHVIAGATPDYETGAPFKRQICRSGSLVTRCKEKVVQFGPKIEPVSDVPAGLTVPARPTVT